MRVATPAKQIMSERQVGTVAQWSGAAHARRLPAECVGRVTSNPPYNAIGRRPAQTPPQLAPYVNETEQSVPDQHWLEQRMLHDCQCHAHSMSSAIHHGATPANSSNRRR
ncbi:hypothetical protein BVI434_1230038 [Burkholderia vietnamiensis]|nr:hypothetical protein BVI434_1230038 [Burkholderia vietnamiensis]